MPPATISYDVKSVLQAHALHWRNAFFGKRFVRILIIFSVFAALLYGGIAYLTNSETREIFYVTVGAAVGAVVLLVAISLLNRAFYIPYVARKSFAQMKEYHAPWTFQLEVNKVVITNSRGNAQLPLTDFVKWANNKDVILLYRTDRLFNFIPMRAITAEQKAALVDALQSANVPYARFWNC